jgi:outer membrane protein OmpA-like peptidoglycan-associated protein
MKPSAVPARTATPAPYGTLQRKCCCGGTGIAGEGCEECKKKPQVQRHRASHGDGPASVPPQVNEVLRSPGEPLDVTTRAFFEPRFGHDFSRVRVHTDAQAAESVRAVNAFAYTVGQHVVFGAGQHAPSTRAGQELLAHELTHVLQQKGSPEPNFLRLGSVDDPREREADATAQAAMGGGALRSMQPSSRLIQRQAAAPSSTTDVAPNPPVATDQPAGPASAPANPKGCPAPSDMGCPVSISPVVGVTNTILFPVNSALLGGPQKAELDAAAASWNSRGAKGTVSVDGYASAEGPCENNWILSCRRAHAVADELQHPINGAKGIPAANLALAAHGESLEAGPALEPNRRVTVSVPGGPPPPKKEEPKPEPKPEPEP